MLDDYNGTLVRVKFHDDYFDDVVGELESWTHYWVQIGSGDHSTFIPWTGIAWLRPEKTP